MYKKVNEHFQTKSHYQISDIKYIHSLTERQSATFNVEEFTQFMFGRPGNPFDINARPQLIRLASAHPIHRTCLPLEYLDADEHYSICIRKSLLLFKKQIVSILLITNIALGFFDIFTNYYFAFYIHTLMCLHALENLASEEQKRQFLPLAQSYRIIATYAQIELDHGTDIRRLEIEVVFDLPTDIFVLNSPRLTSTKLWPGSLGKTVNYVLLMAQLYTPGRDHSCGLQMFLVKFVI